MFVHRPIYIVQCSHQVYGVFLINVIQFGCAIACLPWHLYSTPQIGP